MLIKVYYAAVRVLKFSEKIFMHTNRNANEAGTERGKKSIPRCEQKCR